MNRETLGAAQDPDVAFYGLTLHPLTLNVPLPSPHQADSFELGDKQTQPRFSLMRLSQILPLGRFCTPGEVVVGGTHA